MQQVTELVPPSTEMAGVSRSITVGAPTPGADAPPAGTASSRPTLSARQIIALQRSVGNRAVSSMMGTAVVQRVAVKEATKTETLYNTENASTQATANFYTMNPKYEMTRSGDTGVTVQVKIKFLSQTRNNVDPNAPGAPAGTPALNTLLGSPTEIPANDPRRAWATGVIQGAVTHWNGHLTLVGEEWNLTTDNTKKRLPVTFQSVAVFGLNEEAHSQVIVHPTSTTAGSPGNPIDAGNYYMNKGNYTGDEKVIAAHEYGHLLGIPDEYSQSNEQLNALIHQAAPGDAPSSRAALDRATVERMVLVALTAPLSAQLGAAMPAITDSLRAKRKLVKTKMAAAAKAAAVSAEVRNELTSQLTAASDSGLAPSVPGVVAFETTANFSNVGRAGEGVGVVFDPGVLSQQISDAYSDILTTAAGTSVAVKGLGDVAIDVHGSVASATAAGGAQAAPAGALATAAVGPAPAPGSGAAPGLPAIAPPSTLAAKLEALPATWATAGSALESGVTDAAFAASMVAGLKSAAASATAAAAALPAGAAPSPKMHKQRALYARAYQMVSNAALDASVQVATDLVATVTDPVLRSSVSDLQASISTEVTRIMGTPPAAVPGLGTPDPNMVAMVAAMKTRLDADKTATAGGGRDPLKGGTGTAPAQDVTYSYQGLMGSSETTALRPDQFGPMVQQFNDKLSTTFEKKFTAEVK